MRFVKKPMRRLAFSKEVGTLVGYRQKRISSKNQTMAYYYEHPDLTLPYDDYVIWRYMDFSKFQLMMKEDALFFSRADKQADRHEGEYPEEMLADLEKTWGPGVKSNDGSTYRFNEWHNRKEKRSRLISCWSASLTETQRRWEEYTTNTESISIRSTIGRLKNCFHEKDENVVWIGKVRYGEEENRLNQSISKSGVNYFLYPFFKKEETFRWENEIRATVNLAQKKQTKLGHSPNGCYVNADLKILIEDVWINPQSSIDFRSQVETMLACYNFKSVDIYQSSWNSLPYL